jgi:hypothetical protein
MMDQEEGIDIFVLASWNAKSNSRLISHQSGDWIVLKPGTNPSFGSLGSDTKKTPVTPRFPGYG